MFSNNNITYVTVTQHIYTQFLHSKRRQQSLLYQCGSFRLTLAPTSSPRAVTTLTLSQGRSRGHTCLIISLIIFHPFSFGLLSWMTLDPLNCLSTPTNSPGPCLQLPAPYGDTMMYIQIIVLDPLVTSGRIHMQLLARTCPLG
jgi:hypothetical protein